MDIGSLVGSIQLKDDGSDALQSVIANVQRFGTQVVTSASSLDLFSRSLDNVNKLVTDLSGADIAKSADEWAAAIERVGGVTALTASEQAKANAIIDEAIQKYEAMGQEVPPTLEKIAADLKAVQDAEQHAGEAAGSFGSKILEIATGVSLGNLFTKAAEGLVDFGKELVANSFNLENLADKTGLSTEYLQKLQALAEETGTSVDSMAMAVERLGINMEKGGKNVNDAMMTLNLNLADLKRLSPEEQFDTIARALDNLTSTQERNKTGMELFGRSYITISGSIKHYSEVIDEATAATDEHVKAAAEVEKTYEALKHSLTTFATDILGDIIIHAKQSIEVWQAWAAAVQKATTLPGGFNLLTQTYVTGTQQMTKAEEDFDKQVKISLDPLGQRAKLTALLGAQGGGTGPMAGMKGPSDRSAIDDLKVMVDMWHDLADSTDQATAKQIADFKAAGVSTKQLAEDYKLPQEAIELIIKDQEAQASSAKKAATEAAAAAKQQQNAVDAAAASLLGLSKNEQAQIDALEQVTHMDEISAATRTKAVDLIQKYEAAGQKLPQDLIDWAKANDQYSTTAERWNEKVTEQVNLLQGFNKLAPEQLEAVNKLIASDNMSVETRKKVVDILDKMHASYQPLTDDQQKWLDQNEQYGTNAEKTQKALLAQAAAIQKVDDILLKSQADLAKVTQDTVLSKFDQIDLQLKKQLDEQFQLWQKGTIDFKTLMDNTVKLQQAAGNERVAAEIQTNDELAQEMQKYQQKIEDFGKSASQKEKDRIQQDLYDYLWALSQRSKVTIEDYKRMSDAAIDYANKAKKAIDAANIATTLHAWGQAFSDVSNATTGAAHTITAALSGIANTLGDTAQAFADFAKSGNVWQLIANSVSIATKAIDQLVQHFSNATKTARENFATQTEGFASLDAMYKDLQSKGAAGQALANVGLNVIGKHDTAAEAAWEKQVQDFYANLQQEQQQVDTNFQTISQTITQAGATIPKDLQPAIDALAQAGNTDAAQKGIDAMSAAYQNYADIVSGTNAFKQAEADAKSLGLTADQMNNKFRALAEQDTARTIAQQWAELAPYMNNTIDLASKFSQQAADMVTQFEQNGIAIPKSMEPVLQSLADAGQLVDDAGNKVTDLSQLKFDEGDPLVAGLNDLNDTLKELVTTLQGQLPQAFGVGANAGVSSANQIAAAYKNTNATINDTNAAAAATPQVQQPAAKAPVAAQGHAGGGIVYAQGGATILPFAPRGSDTVPAMLTPGERVLTVDETRRYDQQAQSQDTHITLVMPDGEVLLRQIVKARRKLG